LHNFVPPLGGAAAVCGEVHSRFSGEGKPFLRLLVRGGFLQLVTFGFYRFWLMTDIRRHLWSATSIGGDALEYLGRGRELLIGFLFAVAVLAPVFLVYFLLGVEAERYRAFASFPLYLLLFVFGQFAVYRARRYRLTRTMWRGVRFWMSGGGWFYALRSLLWSAFAYVTLGLANPWRAAALERYKMRNTYYGDMQGSFVGTGWDLFKRGIGLWLVLAVAVGGGLAACVAIVLNAPRSVIGGDIVMHEPTAAIAVFAVFGVIGLICLIVWPIYQAIEWRWWAAGVRLGPVEATSALPRAKILTLYLKILGWGLLAAIVLGAVILVFAYAFTAGAGFAAGLAGQTHDGVDPNSFVPPQYLVVGLMALAYLIFLTALGIILRFYLQHQFWRAFVDTLTIRNLEATESVSARGEAANAFGEGLLDGLDMGGF
jgi:uncharacterized membrane protein YjgN (DUF898 family)